MRALVLSGGGARGAYQVGVLRALATSIDPKDATPFRIITGVSVGALNAAVLASRADSFQQGTEQLEQVWRGLHCADVFRTDGISMLGTAAKWMRAGMFGWAGFKPPRSLLDNTPLRNLVYDHVNTSAIGKAIADGVIDAVAITASSYHSGRAVTFYEAQDTAAPWARARRIGRPVAIAREHVMASAALPFIFPAVLVEGSWYGDGALRENAPLSASIHLGATSVLTIAARDLRPDPLSLRSDDDYPSVGEVTGQLLDVLFNDNAQTDLETLQRLNALIDGHELTVPGTGNPLRRIDHAGVSPSQDIRVIMEGHIAEVPRNVRLALSTVGGMRPPYVLPSYLIFEPGYIGALIDLGYKDGIAAMPRILRTLGIEAKKDMPADVS